MIVPANLTAHVSDGTCMSRAGPDSIGLACSGNQTENTQALSVYFCYVGNDVCSCISAFYAGFIFRLLLCQSNSATRQYIVRLSFSYVGLPFYVGSHFFYLGTILFLPITAHPAIQLVFSACLLDLVLQPAYYIFFVSAALSVTNPIIRQLLLLHLFFSSLLYANTHSFLHPATLTRAHMAAHTSFSFSSYPTCTYAFPLHSSSRAHLLSLRRHLGSFLLSL
jgi:hypothetical protein